MRGADGEEGALDGALRELIEAWMTTSEGWRDAARSEVDRDHIEPIMSRSRQAARALSELAILCSDAMRRCE